MAELGLNRSDRFAGFFAHLPVSQAHGLVDILWEIATEVGQDRLPRVAHCRGGWSVAKILDIGFPDLIKPRSGRVGAECLAAIDLYGFRLRVLSAACLKLIASSFA